MNTPPSSEEMITQTRKWVLDVVVGENFCPFAAKEVKMNSIHYEVAPSGNKKESIQALLLECERLDAHPEIETTLLLIPFQFDDFLQYLKLVAGSEKMIIKNGYEGVYQVAGFHPMYCFEGSDEADAANYTNRSIYPMLHLLREESVEHALDKFPHPENIPIRNIDYTRKKGLLAMEKLRALCK